MGVKVKQTPLHTRAALMRVERNTYKYRRVLLCVCLPRDHSHADGNCC